MLEWLERAFTVNDPMTMFGMVLAGIPLGYYILWPTPTARYGGAKAQAIAMAITGTVVLASAMALRFMEGSPTWHGWIGVWVLFMADTVGAWVGMSGRSYRTSRRTRIPDDAPDPLDIPPPL